MKFKKIFLLILAFMLILPAFALTQVENQGVDFGFSGKGPGDSMVVTTGFTTLSWGEGSGGANAGWLNLHGQEGSMLELDLSGDMTITADHSTSSPSGEVVIGLPKAVTQLNIKPMTISLSTVAEGTGPPTSGILGELSVQGANLSIATGGQITIKPMH